MHLNINMFFNSNLLHIFTKVAIVGAGFLVDVDKHAPYGLDSLLVGGDKLW